MKVIFLDMDGVLNCADTFNQPRSGREVVDDAKVALLAGLIERTGAKVVVSSTWRFSGLGFMRDVLKRYGLANADDVVIDCTPDATRLSHYGSNYLTPPRGQEIGLWLADHPEVEAFVILDDDADMTTFMPQLVKTTFQKGLLPHHVAMAESLLLIERRR